MARKAHHEEHVNHERWLVSYADFITLLFATFTALYALGRSDADKAKSAAESMRIVFGTPQNSLVKMDGMKPKKYDTKGHPDAPEKSDEQAARSVTQATRSDLESMKHAIEEFLMTQNKFDKVQVESQERGLVISMKESGLFESGRAEVKEESKKIFQELGAQFAKFRNPLRVEGHTDNTPMSSRTYPTNWELSTARATNVLQTLVNHYGIAPDKISAVGYGEFRPISENTTPAGRARNRRVDIVILSASAERSEPKVMEEHHPSNTEESPSGHSALPDMVKPIDVLNEESSEPAPSEEKSHEGHHK